LVDEKDDEIDDEKVEKDDEKVEKDDFTSKRPFLILP